MPTLLSIFTKPYLYCSYYFNVCLLYHIYTHSSTKKPLFRIPKFHIFFIKIFHFLYRTAQLTFHLKRFHILRFVSLLISISSISVILAVSCGFSPQISAPRKTPLFNSSSTISSSSSSFISP